MDPTGASHWVTQRIELSSKDIKAVVKDNGHQWTAQPVPSAPESRGRTLLPPPTFAPIRSFMPRSGHHLETSLWKFPLAVLTWKPTQSRPAAVDPGTNSTQLKKAGHSPTTGHSTTPQEDQVND